jgi:hypothetical protein
MKKIEYQEGPEAGANFRELATALFQVPKDGRKKKRQPKKATSRKSHGSDKD